MHIRKATLVKNSFLTTLLVGSISLVVLQSNGVQLLGQAGCTSGSEGCSCIKDEMYGEYCNFSQSACINSICYSGISCEQKDSRQEYGSEGVYGAQFCTASPGTSGHDVIGNFIPPSFSDGNGVKCDIEADNGVFWCPGGSTCESGVHGTPSCIVPDNMMPGISIEDTAQTDWGGDIVVYKNCREGDDACQDEYYENIKACDAVHWWCKKCPNGQCPDQNTTEPTDNCPDDPNKTEPGTCGCGTEENTADTDGDGYLDCKDSCPTNPDYFETIPTDCGCEIGVIDNGEECDGGLACSPSCTCFQRAHAVEGGGCECDDGYVQLGDECVECTDNSHCTSNTVSACDVNVCKPDNTCGESPNTSLCYGDTKPDTCLKCVPSDNDSRGYSCSIDRDRDECRCAENFSWCGEDPSAQTSEQKAGLDITGDPQCCHPQAWCSWKEDTTKVDAHWVCATTLPESIPPPEPPSTECSGRVGCDKEICEGQVDFCYNGDQCTQPWCNLESGECEYIPWQVPVDGCNDSGDTGGSGTTDDDDDAARIGERSSAGLVSSTFSGSEESSLSNSSGESTDSISSEETSSSEGLTHTACVDNACTMVLEAGEDECSTDADCLDQSSSSLSSITSSSTSSSTSSTTTSSLISSNDSSMISSILSSITSSTNNTSVISVDSSNSSDASAGSDVSSIISTSSADSTITSISSSQDSSYVSTIIALQSSSRISLTLSLASESSAFSNSNIDNDDDDDGISDNNSNTSRRSSSPTLVAAASVCGNGVLEEQEECDDSNRRDNDGCSSSCLLEIGICGDGRVQKLLGEQCEQSLHDSALPYTCVGCLFISKSCGDGKVDPGEECDDGIQNSTSLDANCRPNCHLGSCGDGLLDSVELCDDGNRFSGDGCDRYCRIEGTNQIASDITVTEFKNTLPATVTQTQSAFNQYQFPQYPNFQQLPYQLPLAQLRPLTQGQAPIGDTGPAAVVVAASGMAAGIGWIRKKKRR